MPAGYLQGLSKVRENMTLKLWRTFTIVLTALLVSLCFAELWDIRARLAMQGANWLYAMNMHEAFIDASAGPLLQIATVGAAFVLLGMLRDDPRAFWWSLGAAATLLVAFIVWWAFIYPVEMRVNNLTASSLPANWTSLRLRWEIAQVARAALAVAALSSLVVAALLARPVRRARRRSRYFMIG